MKFMSNSSKLIVLIIFLFFMNLSFSECLDAWGEDECPGSCCRETCYSTSTQQCCNPIGPLDYICSSSQVCKLSDNTCCTPNSNSCGPDGCDGSHGGCSNCQTCSGGSCTGGCTSPQVCHGGSCCSPSCPANKCGTSESNGCGGTINCASNCVAPKGCEGGLCVTSCTPNCDEKCAPIQNACTGEDCNGCTVAKPACNSMTGLCVQCMSTSNCPIDIDCNTATKECCSSPTSYFNSTFEGGKCVMCNNDCQCTAGQKCVSHSCVSETCGSTNTGKVLIGNDCLSCPNCPPKSCVCPPEYPDEDAKGNCICNPSSCGSGYVCINGDCSPTCEDGTPVYTCNYSIPPKYCGPAGLTDNCTYCNNCGISGSCMTNGSCCNLLYPDTLSKKYWNGTTCTECNKSTHCDAGEKCVFGECEQCTPVTSICPTCPSAAQYWNGSACAECIVGFVNCLDGKVCSEGRCVEGCSDGTHTALPGECLNGKYCYTDGQFEPKCYINEALGCECPSGTCNEVTGNCDAPVAVSKCSDGTINNTCSQSKPFFCNNLFFESSCMQCGCPDSYTCNIDGTCTMNQQVDEQGNLSLIFQNATEGACVEGAMGWAKVDGKLTPDCTTCGCPVSYQCGSNNRCVSLLNLQAPAAPVGVTCPNGQVLNEGFVCVDCKLDECGKNMECSKGHCCPSYTPTWNGTKCTCASGSEGGCSSIKPWRCNEDGSFLPNCEVCGCPPDYDCRESVCREKPGASLRKVQIPDINPVIALLTLFSFLFFFNSIAKKSIS